MIFGGLDRTRHVLVPRAFVLLRRASHFLSLAREKVTKERGTPLTRLAGIHARKVRVRITGFVDRASCPDAKLVRIPANHPAGFPPPARRFRGAPSRAARSQRAPFRRARSAAKQRQSDASLWSLLYSSSPSAGHDGPRLYPGPLRGGESGSTGREAGIDRDVDAFSPGQDALSKSPTPAHGLAAHEWAASAKRGVDFSWLLLFWTSKREVTRAPQEHESSALNQQNRARAGAAKAAPSATNSPPSSHHKVRSWPPHRVE